MANEFDCVSERPPPTTCQQRALTVTTTSTSTPSTTSSTTTPSSTTTTTTPPSTTTTSPPPSSTTTGPSSTTSTTAASSATSATWTFIRRGNYDGYEYVIAVFYLYDASGNPVSGRTVDVSVRVNSGNQVASGGCTTGSGDQAGRCAAIYGIPNSAGDVYLVATGVRGTPPLDPPPQTSPVAPA